MTYATAIDLLDAADRDPPHEGLKVLKFGLLENAKELARLQLEGLNSDIKKIKRQPFKPLEQPDLVPIQPQTQIAPRLKKLLCRIDDTTKPED